METCLGVTTADDRAVARSIERLSLGVIAFVREHDPTVDPQTGVSEALVSGAFQRHLAAVFANRVS